MTDHEKNRNAFISLGLGLLFFLGAYLILHGDLTCLHIWD